MGHPSAKAPMIMSKRNSQHDLHAHSGQQFSEYYSCLAEVDGMRFVQEIPSQKF